MQNRSSEEDGHSPVHAPAIAPRTRALSSEVVERARHDNKVYGLNKNLEESVRVPIASNAWRAHFLRAQTGHRSHSQKGDDGIPGCEAGRSAYTPRTPDLRKEDRRDKVYCSPEKSSQNQRRDRNDIAEEEEIDW